MVQAETKLLDPKLYAKPQRKELKGLYTVLQPFDKAVHSSALFNAFSLDKEGADWRYLTYGPFATESSFCNWVEMNCLRDDPFFYTLCKPEDLNPLGMLSLLNIESIHGKVELAHVHFSQKLQQTRTSTEAIYLVMKLIFDELGYRRLEWKCNNENLRSKQAALRLGFTFEGIFRQHWIIKSQNRDTAWFSIIDKEWPAIKARFERWLDPANFDNQGQQIRKLSATYP